MMVDIDIKSEIKSAFAEVACDMERRVISHTHKTVEETVKDVFKKMEKAVDDRLRLYGFNPENTQQTQANLLYLQKLREGSEEINKWIKRGAVMALVSAVIYALTKGIGVGIIDSANQIREITGAK